MPISIAQFLERLQASELVSAKEVEALGARFPKSKRWQDADGLIRELIESKTLTRFQAETILEDRAYTLVLGDYVVLREIGEGGMGHVYLARHRRLKREVALKVLSANFTQNEAAIKRFQREMEAAARLSHPNIVATFDAREQSGFHYLVMEYVAGDNLAKVVERVGRLPVATALDYAMQTAKGLAHAHQQGVVHRDIKPANLLLDSEGRVKILDMGIARFDGAMLGGEPSGITKVGSLMGTAAYMAPEQALDVRKADARSDIYSLGCTLYYLLTGREMYPRDTYMEQIVAHREDPIPALKNLKGEPPPGLSAVFQKLVAKNPADRFQNMDKVYAALAACRPIEAPKPVEITDSIRVLIGPGDGPAKQAAPIGPGTIVPVRSDTLAGPPIAHEPPRSEARPATPERVVNPPVEPAPDPPRKESARIEPVRSEPPSRKPDSNPPLPPEPPPRSSTYAPISHSNPDSVVRSEVYFEPEPGDVVPPGTAVYPRYGQTLADDEPSAVIHPPTSAGLRDNQATHFDDDTPSSAAPPARGLSSLPPKSQARPPGKPKRLLPRLAALFLLLVSCVGLAVAIVVATTPPRDKSSKNAKLPDKPDPPPEPEDPPVEDPRPKVVNTVPEPPKENGAEKLAIAAKAEAEAARAAWKEAADNLPEKYHPPEAKEAAVHWMAAEASLAAEQFGDARAGYEQAGQSFETASRESKKTRELLAAAQAELDKVETKRKEWQKTSQGIAATKLPASAAAADEAYTLAQDSMASLGGLAQVVGHAARAGKLFDDSISAMTSDRQKALAAARSRAKSAWDEVQDQIGKSSAAVKGIHDQYSIAQGWQATAGGALKKGDALAPTDHLAAIDAYAHGADAAGQLAAWLAEISAAVKEVDQAKGLIDADAAKQRDPKLNLLAWPKSKLAEAQKHAQMGDAPRAIAASKEASMLLAKASEASDKRPPLPLQAAASSDELGGFAKVAVKRTAGDDSLRAGKFVEAETHYREARELYPMFHAPANAQAARRSQAEWAAALDTKIVEPNEQGIKLALIPPGEFEMGASEEELKTLLASDPTLKREAIEQELPRHRVRISRPFRLAMYETTQGEFERVLDRKPSWGTASRLGVKETDLFPVENISWLEAAEFCNELSRLDKLPAFYLLKRNKAGAIKGAETVDPHGKGYRLPTEAEWEFACRAGSESFFHFGSALDGRQANIDGDYPFGGASVGPHLQRTASVGSYAPNPFGLFDMHGNVAEWCQDGYESRYYTSFAAGVAKDPPGSSSHSERAVRGGSWISYARNARSAARAGHSPTFRDLNIGFRVAKSE